MTIFSQISSTSQATVAAATAMMNELGVSASTSAQILDNAFRGLNFNAAQSSKLLLDLRGTARALEVPVEQLASDFLTAQNRIIQLGDRGPDAFDKLAAAAKGTGVSVEGLLGLTSQFDSFESASKTAAKAAAALGTGVIDVMTRLTNKIKPSKIFMGEKDFQQFIGFGVQLLMFASPVILPISIAEKMSNENPEGWGGLLKTVLEYNPMSPIIEGFRSVFFTDYQFDINRIGYSLSIGFILFIFGALLFRKTEQNFMDTV